MKANPDPHTLPKRIIALRLLEEVVLGDNPRSTLCLSHGVVGAPHTGVFAREEAIRDFALTLARWPAADGKMALFRCPFLFAPIDTFEPIDVKIPADVLAAAQETAKMMRFSAMAYHFRDSFIRYGNYRLHQYPWADWSI